MTAKRAGENANTSARGEFKQGAFKQGAQPLESLISEQISLMRLQLAMLEKENGLDERGAKSIQESVERLRSRLPAEKPAEEKTEKTPRKSDLPVKKSSTARPKTSAANDKRVNLVRGFWEQTLGIKNIPADANFFSIGGHSLLAVDICHKVYEKTGTRLSLKDMAANPTLERFAKLLPEHTPASGADTEKKHNRENARAAGAAKGADEIELSLTQFQAWYRELVNKGTTLHALPYGIRVSSRLDMARFNRALKAVMNNHPSLRSAIQTGPVQRLFPLEEAFSNAEPKLEVSLDEKAALADMQELALKPFDLEKPPLFRSKVYRLGEKDHILFFCFHHIVFDGWSSEVFFQNLSLAYAGEVLKPEETGFFDHVVWQKKFLESPRGKRELDRWLEKLKAPLPELDLPTDYPRPAVADYASETLATEIGEGLTEKARSFCKKRGLSLFSLLLGVYQKTLLDYSGQNELVVGIPVRGRNGASEINTIGYFANGAAIRTSMTPGITDYLRQTQREVAEAVDLQNIPFEKVRDALKLKRDPSRSPVAQAFFAYQDLSHGQDVFDGKSFRRFQPRKSFVHTDLDMSLNFEGKKIKGVIEYRKDLFRRESVKRMADYFLDLLNFVVEGKAENWDRFHSRSLEAALKKANDTFKEFPRGKTVADYVDEKASSEPDRVAVRASDRNLTYGELSRLSSLMAGRLRRAGVGPGQLAGVSLDRDGNLLVAALGIMKTGAGYLPLDPYFPPERLAYMVEQSGLGVVLGNEKYRSLFGGQDLDFLAVEEINLEDESPANIAPSPDSCAYVIYTSGSTGRPKGVDISYRGMMNFLYSMLEKPGFGPNNRLLAVTTFCFDISVLELFLPLVAGGETIIAGKEDTIDGDALLRTIKEKNVDILQATPPTWRILLAAGWKGGKNFKALCGGEAFPRDLLESLIPICGSVWNMYGPTETTVWATCKKMESSQGPVLIGRPVHNYRAYVLNENLRPVPFGAVGELYIAGEGLARGYYKREDLTRERFLADPVRGKGKMYKTGDLARFHSNGELECLGRNDDQVKVRGYRIELGEIEAALAELEETSQTVVMAREDRPGDTRLVAYIKTENNEEPDHFSLRERLGRKLPPYMIPVNYIKMDEFPLTLTGKVDKKKLPAVDFDRALEEGASRRDGEEDVGDIERRLAKIWMNVIGAADYSLDDDYFEAGGNSLLSVDLFSKISEEFGIDLPLSTLVSNSRFEQLLETVAQKCDKVSGPEEVSERETAEPDLKIPQICSSLVEIKKGGNQTPVFCFHGVGGNVLNYVQIAPHFGARPVIGVQSQGADGVSEPLKSVDDMARKYMEEIKLVCPQGPYLLAGGSMGGLLAYETAKKLRDSGEEVLSVVMFDTFGPGCDFNGYNSKGRLGEALFSLKWNIKRVFFSVQSAVLGSLGMPVPHKTRYFNIEALNYQALWAHSCSEYGGDVDLIRAPVADNGWYSMPDMGWKSVVEGQTRVHYVNGGHENFVEAKEFPETLKRVLARY